jgi:hypothetical protein
MSETMSETILYTLISLVTLSMQVRGSNCVQHHGMSDSNNDEDRQMDLSICQVHWMMTIYVVTKWMMTIYVIAKINFLRISVSHRRKDPFLNSWPTCLARWTAAHLLLMLDNQSDLLLMTGRILVKNTSLRHTALHVQSCYGSSCQQNWLSGLGQIFAKNRTFPPNKETCRLSQN